jgi:hypothetical protein
MAATCTKRIVLASSNNSIFGTGFSTRPLKKENRETERCSTIFVTAGRFGLRFLDTMELGSSRVRSSSQFQMLLEKIQKVAEGSERA